MTVTRPTLRRLSDRTVEEIAPIIGAGPPHSGGRLKFGPISTDSRTIRPGDFYLALRGLNFDGHAFCADALGRGAAGLVVRHDFTTEHEGRVPVLRVPDPLLSYGDLARFQRDCWGGQVIAISGSVGKTTVRRLVARALAAHRKTLEPIRNYNNLIGVPRTLLRLEGDHEVAVLELGMNMPGELRRLTEIARPDVAGLTRIGRAHVGQFRSLEELIEAKLEMIEFTAAGSPIVINAACAASRRALERFSSTHRVTTFRGEGAEEADCTIENVSPIDPVGYRFDLVTPPGRVDGITLRHFGRHMLENVAASAAFLVAAGYDPGWIAPAVENFETEPLRGQIVQAGDWTFILDCYNAAPESMHSALESLADLRRDGRLILVLGDMGELGSHCEVAHDSLLAPIERLEPAAVFGRGPQFSRLCRVLASGATHAEGFEDPAELTEALRAALRPGDTVFFKGSRAMALENVAQALVPEAQVLNASPDAG